MRAYNFNPGTTIIPPRMLEKLNSAFVEYGTSGLGVLERGHVGLYDIYVDAACRRRGLGGDICSAIMLHGKNRGCDTAYLQVLADNFGARRLYHQLGYEETYGYWFRVKEL